MLRTTSNGAYLGHEKGDTGVLLPNKYLPETFDIGDTLDVFVYTDSEDRIIATNLTPKITLHRFAFLEVKAVTKFGAFLDWGLEKELLVPNQEQNKRMQVGEKHCVFLFLDEDTHRLVATAKLDRCFSKELELSDGDEVSLLVYRSTELGFEVIIDNRYLGLLYKNEIFSPIKIGERTSGFIKKIREDYKIDVSLQKQGYAQIETSQKELLDHLRKNNGFLKLTDKSDPETITNTVSMSKKTFKKAVGALYKQRLITIEEDGIKLAS